MVLELVDHLYLNETFSLSGVCSSGLVDYLSYCTKQIDSSEVRFFCSVAALNCVVQKQMCNTGKELDEWFYKLCKKKKKALPLVCLKRFSVMFVRCIC